jgi:hypothetical protein
MQKKPVVVRVLQKASYTTTNAFANIYSVAAGDFVCKATVSGYYDIAAILNTYNDGAGDYTMVRLAINGDPIAGTTQQTYTNNFIPITLVCFSIFLKAGDIVSAQAKYVASSTVIPYTAGAAESSLTIVKRP